MAETETTQPDPAATDGGSKATEGAEGGKGGEDGAEKVSIPKHEYDALRRRAEAENEEIKTLRSKMAELNGRSQPPTTDPKRAKYNEYVSKLRAAAATNPDAEALLSIHDNTIEESNATLKEARNLLEMAEIPVDQRDAVRQKMRETGAPSPKLAYGLLRGDGLSAAEQRIAKLETELAEARAKKPAPAGTGIRGGAAQPGKGTEDGVEYISAAEYQKRMANPTTKDKTKTAIRAKTVRIRE